MAWQGATYKPNDLIVEVKAMIKSMPIDTASANALEYQIVDSVCSLVWMAAPWWWTVGTMTNVSVVGGTQDYTITVPNDFLYLLRCVLQTGSDGYSELVPVSTLPSNITQVGIPQQVAVVSVSSYPIPDTLRVSPNPSTSFTGTANLTYKRQPPKITSANFNTTGAMILPDCWYPVLQAGVLWKAFQYADDNRAGTATVSEEGKTQWTQQSGIFFGLIAEMRRSEKLTLQYPGVPVQHG